MSEQPVRIIIQDILESIDNILSFTEGMDYNQYCNDIKTRHAVERDLEIIGEAANNLPDHFYAQYDAVEWHKIISMRNRLIHGYFTIEDEIVWNVVQHFLRPLRNQLQGILDSL